MQFYKETKPAVGDRVIADCVRITDTAVYCVLPAYMNIEVMVPLTEIGIKRHRKVTDYIQIHKRVVLEIITVDGERIDASLKQVRDSEAAAALEEFHARKHIDLIVRTADKDRALDFMGRYVWPYSLEEVRARFEEIKAAEGIDVAGAEPPELVAAICAKQPTMTYTAEKEVMLRFGLAPDGAVQLTATLRSLAAQEGVSVFVTGPPRYRIVATDKTRVRAEARLAAAVADLPPLT